MFLMYKFSLPSWEVLSFGGMYVSSGRPRGVVRIAIILHKSYIGCVLRPVGLEFIKNRVIFVFILPINRICRVSQSNLCLLFVELRRINKLYCVKFTLSSIIAFDTRAICPKYPLFLSHFDWRNRTIK